MSESNAKVSRREFLQTSAVVAAGGAALSTSALSYARIVGANERISLGHIGVGVRGGELQGMAAQLKDSKNVEMTAELHALGEIRQRGGKIVTAFAVEIDIDTTNVRSNTFELEWPPRSGRRQTFPEVDRAEWFDLASARTRINEGQLPLLERLATIGPVEN